MDTAPPHEPTVELADLAEQWLQSAPPATANLSSETPALAGSLTVRHVIIARDMAPPDAPSTPHLRTSGNCSLPTAHEPPAENDGYRASIIRDFEVESVRTERHELRHLTQIPGHVQWSGIASAQHFASANLVGLGERLLERLHWRERLRHFTWSFFTITMATGGIANVIYEVPYRFRGLHSIGLFFFLLNIVFFLINVVMLCLRFYDHPEMFKASILHPTERLFVPSAVVSFGTVLLNISQYGPHHTGDWLNEAIAALFWIDAGLAFLASMGIYLIMWSTASFTISQMTPVWIFPAYPLLILGPHAGVLSQTLHRRDRALEIIVGGFTLQGIGFLVSLLIYSAFLQRLMTQKLPQEATRPGMFVSVGPAAFTAAGILGMAEGAQLVLPDKFMGDGTLAKLILKVVASWSCLWLWGLAMWFFCISVGAHWSCVQHGRMTFTMSWFSYVFPQTALITATFGVGKAFNVPAIQWLGCAMTPLLILVWIVVVAMMLRAIYLRQILWPQKGEDKDEGGFKGPPMMGRRRTFSV